MASRQGINSRAATADWQATPDKINELIDRTLQVEGVHYITRTYIDWLEARLPGSEVRLRQAGYLVVNIGEGG